VNKEMSEEYDNLRSRLTDLNEQMNDDKRSIAEKDGIITAIIDCKMKMQKVKDVV
jgi:hypothetical protein